MEQKPPPRSGMALCAAGVGQLIAGLVTYFVIANYAADTALAHGIAVGVLATAFTSLIIGAFLKS